jgi:NAD(P)-dependent dehydrogenase (short-subunit alcohol dehydrogenase family)
MSRCQFGKRCLYAGIVPGRAAAYSSKWAIIGSMKSAALELGRRPRYDERYARLIQVAGGTPTGALATDANARKGVIRHSPLGVPWIDPANVAPVVVFLASDAACMVSGATYAVATGDSANITA